MGEFKSGIIQILYFAFILLIVFAIVKGIQYLNWKKKADVEIGRKLDEIIHLLRNDRHHY
ncbi:MULTISPECIES: DUF4083 family protein [Paenibacillus]|uniref:DUF4083 family protein n=1 Tax=Paenibacillus TaxID=44249 RepID=UPI003872BE65